MFYFSDGFHHSHSLSNQVRAMLQIMRRFGWTWAGLVNSDDAYGRDAAQIFRSELDRSGFGCLAYLEVMPWDNDPAEIQRIVSVMKTSTARVVIVYVYGIRMVKLMEEVRVTNMIHVNLVIHNLDELY